ncbi:MAG: PQQ-dependent sugar dehydrogenase [Planctomycetes bacterium]|nr:PQQ-dependent sugar dehydrogenase [Planctomycetota bacterium]
MSRPARLLPAALVVSLAACGGGRSAGVVSPPAPGYALQDAFPAQAVFTLPVFLTHHASDPLRYYVVLQDGLVVRVARDGLSSDRLVFLDLRAKVLREGGEEGLLGFTFDPGYATNRHVYVYYSSPLPAGARESILSRFTVVTQGGEPVADVQSEFVVMRIPQPYANHNGGTILFGPDGMLYVALGDGGSAGDPQNRAQDRTTVLGKILRVDVSASSAQYPYAVPPDNPFFNEMGAGVRGEIWCWGIRNPWRMSFDRATGDLWFADVGQASWEEVNKGVKGGNYGWRFFEGTHRYGGGTPPQDLVPPIAEYGHDLGVSVTGGHVYRGTRHLGLAGRYVYGDFGSGRVWCVREDALGAHEVTYLLATGKNIASFAEEPDGELLLLCFDGRIYRLVAAP